MIIIAAIGFAFFAQMFLVTQVRGMDLFPALQDGDLAIVFRLQREYRKNDVIAYETGEGICFGRIVACEGDVVFMDDGGVMEADRESLQSAYGAAMSMDSVVGKVITILRRRI